MFTKGNFLEYFDQIQSIEKQMHRTYQKLSDELEHPEYKKLFGQLAKEEADHMGLVMKLKDLFAK
jgi:rubrerythrin